MNHLRFSRAEGSDERDYCVVVAGGEKDVKDAAAAGLLARSRFIIAADSGVFFLKDLGVVPHVLVGDFDSTDPETVETFRQAGSTIVSLNRDKDKTDTHVALDIAYDKGYRKAFVLGAFGGNRPEHSAANVSLLENFALRGMDVIIHSSRSLVAGVLGLQSPIGDAFSSLLLFASKSDWVSLFPVTRKVTGVTTEGLKFPLKDAVLTRGYTLGVSNEMEAERGKISVKDGYLLVFLTRRS